MGVELLARFVLKAFDEAGPSTDKELLDVCFCELYPADLTEDVEVTRLVAALDDLGKDAHRVLGTERAAVGGICWSFSLQGEEFVTGVCGIASDLESEVFGRSLPCFYS